MYRFIQPTLVVVFTLLFIPSAFAKNKANPDISLSTLFTHTQADSGNSNTAEIKNGFALQEAELIMSSNIDTHFRGSATLAIHESHTTPGEYELSPEEVYAETLSLDSAIIRIGKFYPFFGRSNQFHTHALPFIRPFQSREAIFGEEGFNEIGLSVAYLLPTPWYFEVIAQGFSAKNEKVFGSPAQDDMLSILSLKNLWELGDTSTLQLDLAVGEGKTVTDEENRIYNVSVTFKQKTNRSLIFTTEYNQAEKVFDSTPTNQGRTGALSSWLQYQTSATTWAQVKHEVVSTVENTTDKDKTISSLLLAWVPSEFSALRLQYDSVNEPTAAEAENIVTLQLNLNMGSHPAHEY